MMKRLLAGISVALLAILQSHAVVTVPQSNPARMAARFKLLPVLIFMVRLPKLWVVTRCRCSRLSTIRRLIPMTMSLLPKLGKSVASADLVVASGIGYDGWMDKVVKSADKSKNYLRVADDLMNKKEGDNEHIWYDPRTMPKLANTLADKFAKKDPADKATFKANAKIHRFTGRSQYFDQQVEVESKWPTR